jgi:hypothetical protein
VEQLVLSTGLKYGGPNNSTTAGDAFGGISFQVWDPQPITAGAQLAVDTSGRVDVGKVAGTAQTARDLGAQLDAAVSTRAPSSTALSTATWTGTRAALLDNLDAAVSTRLATSGYTAPDNTRPTNFNALAITAAGAVTAGTVGDKTGYALTAAYDPAKTAASSVDYTAARAAKLDNLDAAVTTRLASASYTAPDNAGITTIGTRLTAQRALNLDNLDAAVSTRSTYAGGDTPGTTTLLTRVDVTLSTRLAASGYTAPDNASVAAIKLKTDNLPPDPADASDIAGAFGVVNGNVNAVASAVTAIDSKLGTPVGVSMSADISSVKSDTAAVKTKTDALTFNAGNVLASLEAVRGNALTGSGAGPYGTA